MALTAADTCTDDSRVDIARTFTEKEKRLVHIRWTDIICHADWTEHSDVTCPEFLSIGWIVSEDAKEIKIGNTLNEEGIPYGITAFPRGCVLEVTDVI